MWLTNCTMMPYVNLSHSSKRRQHNQTWTELEPKFCKELKETRTLSLSLSLFILTAIFQVNLGYRTEQNRTLLPQAKYLWQAARIANMAIYAGCP